MDKFCCDTFKEAHQEGSDADFMGSLIFSLAQPNTFYMGTIDDPINFCAWCGKEIEYD